MNFAPFQYLFNYPLRGRLKVIVYEKSCVTSLPIMSTKRIFALWTFETLNTKSHASVFLRWDCRSCVQLVYECLRFRISSFIWFFLFKFFYLNFSRSGTKKYRLHWKHKDKDDIMTEVTLSMKSKSNVSDKFDLSEALFLGFFKALFWIRFSN